MTTCKELAEALREPYGTAAFFDRNKILDEFVAPRVRRAPCKVGAFPAGANPARPLSLRPVAIGAVMEVTKWLKPSV